MHCRWSFPSRLRQRLPREIPKWRNGNSWDRPKNRDDWQRATRGHQNGFSSRHGRGTIKLERALYWKSRKFPRKIALWSRSNDEILGTGTIGKRVRGQFLQEQTSTRYKLGIWIWLSSIHGLAFPIRGRYPFLFSLSWRGIWISIRLSISWKSETSKVDFFEKKNIKYKSFDVVIQWRYPIIPSLVIY